MSGHSKWSTIKHKKAATDNARGKLFSKLSKAISVAVKTGGSNNPETNYKLKIAVDAAKAANMPKHNIERILAKSEEEGNLYEVTYEAFTPGGAGVLIEAVTDNKNRTAQEVKHAIEKGNGQFVSPGAVSYNFTQKGYLVVKKSGNPDEQMLAMIDLGIEDFEDSTNVFEVYVEPQSLHDIKSNLESNGFEVENASIILKPLTMHALTGSELKSALRLLDTLDDLEDVQNVYTNLEGTEE